jgi:hypothetical protein
LQLASENISFSIGFILYDEHTVGICAVVEGLTSVRVLREKNEL